MIKTGDLLREIAKKRTVKEVEDVYKQFNMSVYNFDKYRVKVKTMFGYEYEINAYLDQRNFDMLVEANLNKLREEFGLKNVKEIEELELKMLSMLSKDFETTLDDIMKDKWDNPDFIELY